MSRRFLERSHHGICSRCEGVLIDQQPSRLHKSSTMHLYLWAVLSCLKVEMSTASCPELAQRLLATWVSVLVLSQSPAAKRTLLVLFSTSHPPFLPHPSLAFAFVFASRLSTLLRGLHATDLHPLCPYSPIPPRHLRLFDIRRGSNLSVATTIDRLCLSSAVLG